MTTIESSVKEQIPISDARVSRAKSYESVILQGSGTFGVAAVLQSAVSPTGGVAVRSNDAYGEQMLRMLQHARIGRGPLRTSEDASANPRNFHLFDFTLNGILCS